MSERNQPAVGSNGQGTEEVILAENHGLTDPAGSHGPEDDRIIVLGQLHSMLHQMTQVAFSGSIDQRSWSQALTEILIELRATEAKIRSLTRAS